MLPVYTMLYQKLSQSWLPHHHKHLPANVFLGLLNYYGRFIPNLASLLNTLHDLLHKEEAWKWTSTGQEVFQKAKAAEVLTHFTPSVPIQLACDASPYRVGAVISHMLPNGTKSQLLLHQGH